MASDKADITVTLSRHTNDDEPLGPSWAITIAVQGNDYKNSDYESEPDALLNWLKSAVAFAMGRIAAEQEHETR